jgi:hypothetical protein
MAQVNKIDSNVTGLRYAEESSLGTLPGTPDWIPLEPNSYDDFGGNFSKVARNPISADRQRKKGVLTDLDAAGGFNNDLTQTNLASLLQGFFFADFRTKGEEIVTAVDLDTSNPDEFEVASTTGFKVDDIILASGFTNSGNNGIFEVTVVTTNTSVEVTTGALTAEASPPADAKITVVGHHFQTGEVDIDATTTTFPRLVRASGSKDFTTFGLVPGEWIFIGGDGTNTAFDTAANNGFKRVRAVGTTYIEFDKSAAAMSNETGSDEDIKIYFGRVLKNETGTDITRRTYNLERTLGAPDDSSPSQIQSEYLVGAVPNELTLNVSSADKITVDLSFIATDHETRTGATGVKSGNRPSLVETDAFNTSSDVVRIKLSEVSSTLEAPTALFAFVQELTITIINNLTPNKAIGTLGAFDVSAGTFSVGGEMTAYFSNVSAIAAVRNNTDMTLDMIMVRENAGIAIDLPLISLSEGRATIEQDTPITLPLTNEAASGAGVLSTMDHTLLMVFFDYLPDAAE